MIDMLAYRRPRSISELWAAFEEAAPPALASAGCTDLIPKSRAGQIPPATWIDLRRVPEMNALDFGEDAIRLGACLTHRQVAADPKIADALPALAAACRAVGSRQIRALGTLGGNAANCSPCADSFLALTALDAEVVLCSPGGTRVVAAVDLPRGPGVTILDEKELIEAFVVPRREGRRSVFLKLGPRRAVSVAKVSVAASARVVDGALVDVRLALGSVAPTVLRARDAEAVVEGRSLEPALLAEVAKLVEAAVRPIDDARSTAAYRRRTSGVLARRALQALAS